MYIDSHQHFWKLSRGDYTWMSEDYTSLFKDFDSNDLRPLIKQKNITKTVIVQAADTISESEFILDIANKTDFVSGVVGWVNFEDKNVKNDIDKLSQNPYLKGFRPMIHDIEDVNWMLKEEIKEGIEYLNTNNLTFDALVRPHHLENLLIFAKKYESLPIVIDHIAKPKIIDGEIDKWKNDMKKLSELDNIFCKYSGILTEVGENYKKEQILPYIDYIFEIFSTKKIMWGSDWPVLTMAENYQTWFDIAFDFIKSLSKDEKNNVFCKTATNFYKL